MGLFGRDDHPPQDNQTLPVTPTRTGPAAPPQAGSNRTLIAGPTRVEGSLTGTGDVVITGEVKGTVNCMAHVEVADGGRVGADINARTIVVAGTVEGDVTAEERIELLPTANLRGSMTAPRILIADGATFHGKVEMTKPHQAAKTETGAKAEKQPAETKKAAAEQGPTEAKKTTTSSARRTGGGSKGRGSK